MEVPDEPPSPEHLRLKEVFPGVSIEISSDPLVDLVPLHPPEAVHDVESEDDHVKVAVEPTSTETTSETKDAIFARIAGAPPPPPPPPPHEAIIKSDIIIKDRP